VFEKKIKKRNEKIINIEKEIADLKSQVKIKNNLKINYLKF